MGVIIAFPFVPPLHEMLVGVTDEVMAPDAVTETVCVLVQPLASVVVQVYVPAVSPVAELVEAPLFHKYVNGAVPPVIFATALPFAAEHIALVGVMASV